MIGFINVIKPAGVSSSFVVGRIKYLLKEKVGHLGTLDPLATGVLPIAIGKATRFFDYFLNKDKEYYALMKLGVETASLDAESPVINKGKSDFSLAEVKAVAEKVKQMKLQTPPLYSAVKLNGKRGYELAREEKDTEVNPKKVQIYEINVEKWHQNDVFRLKIHCSAGTYVRSIVRDIAKNLGTYATTIAIDRTRSGEFKIEDAFTFDEVMSDPLKCIVPVSDIIKATKVSLSKEQAKMLQNGKSLKIKLGDGNYLCYYNDEEFAFLSVSGEKIKKTFLYSKGEVC